MDTWATTGVRRGRGASLPGALAKKNDARRLEQDDEIQDERVVLDVVEIVFQLLDRLLDSRAVRVAHLGPPRQARFDTVPHGVERNLLGQHRHEFRTFGSRADEAHLTFQYVDELRQLVDSRTPQETADARN